jgi:hypothetical protein
MKTFLGGLTVVCLALFVWAGPDAANGGEDPLVKTLLSNDGTYRLTLEFSGAELVVRDLFEVGVRMERSDGGKVALQLAFDARMPEHGHGMNREAEVSSEGGGTFAVSNLLLHMPGLWELYFDVTEGAICERAQFSIDLD